MEDDDGDISSDSCVLEGWVRGWRADEPATTERELCHVYRKEREEGVHEGEALTTRRVPTARHGGQAADEFVFNISIIGWGGTVSAFQDVWESFLVSEAGSDALRRRIACETRV